VYIPRYLSNFRRNERMERPAASMYVKNIMASIEFWRQLLEDILGLSRVSVT
jgi:hypothetical protein